MFERYTEKARRVIFWARYETSRFGSPWIETEHLLIGLFQEDPDLANYFLAGGGVDAIRQQIERQKEQRQSVSTSVDLPLSSENKRILANAAEQSKQMGHKHIGTPHLLLGILLEPECYAARVLQEHGVQFARVREEVMRSETLAEGEIL